MQSSVSVVFCDLFNCFLVLANHVKLVWAWSLNFCSLGVVSGRDYNNFRINYLSYNPNNKSNVWFENKFHFCWGVRESAVTVLCFCMKTPHQYTFFFLLETLATWPVLRSDTWSVGDIWWRVLVYSRHQVSRIRSSFKQSWLALAEQATPVVHFKWYCNYAPFTSNLLIWSNILARASQPWVFKIALFADTESTITKVGLS